MAGIQVRLESATQTPPAPSKGEKKGDHRGRSCKDITKLVAKILGGVLLAAIGVAAIAALVVGILLLVNPLGFGIGNAVGAGLTAASAAIGIALTKVVTVLAAKAVLITVISAIALGGVGAISAGWTIAAACNRRNRSDEDIDGEGEAELFLEPDLAESDADENGGYRIEGRAVART